MNEIDHQAEYESRRKQWNCDCHFGKWVNGQNTYL